ncbi:DUF1007 family protein [Vibrio hepatarius]|uniref:DUF1007 family protein n=1 Tax=Vibrio hepatarius TaxID=171383 RepID=UPI002090E635|nr:DUF1007 family protein [Vibrio hepatarius]
MSNLIKIEKGVMLMHFLTFEKWARSFGRYRLSGLVALIALYISAPLNAHPHSWVDMKTYIEGENGIVSGLKMEWTFDSMTSAYLLDGEDMSPKNANSTLDKIAKTVVKNMLSEHYFTYFYDGETPIKYHLALDQKLEREKSKLKLSFTLPLAKPKSLTRDTLRLLVFDSSYYVDMAWRSKSDIVLSKGLAQQCQLELVEPHPTSKQMMYAMSLPADSDPDNTLGQLFTQMVKMHCALVAS